MERKQIDLSDQLGLAALMKNRRGLIDDVS
jgi:hypothetical protein